MPFCLCSKCIVFDKECFRGLSFSFWVMMYEALRRHIVTNVTWPWRVEMKQRRFLYPLYCIHRDLRRLFQILERSIPSGIPNREQSTYRSKDALDVSHKNSSWSHSYSDRGRELGLWPLYPSISWGCHLCLTTQNGNRLGFFLASFVIFYFS